MSTPPPPILYRCRECGAIGDGDGQNFEFCVEETIDEYHLIEVPRDNREVN